MAQVEILLFAAAKQLVNQDRMILDLSLPTTIKQLKNELAMQCPAIAGLVARSRIAVDNRFVDDEHVIQRASELALIPPVSGG